MNQLDGGASPKPVILVLDDDSAVRESLKFTLGIEGFDARAYSSPTDLLNEDYLAAACGLVVDYHMPAMNGLEVVARLRERHITIPAILVTSHPNENIRARAAAAGVPIVEKPFLGSRLLDAVRTAFGGFPTRSSS